MIENGLSFDVEDWFQVYNYEGIIPRDQWANCELRVVNSTRKILDLLEKKNVTATFFVLGWIADRVPELVQMIAAGDHEIGTHGYWHRRLLDLSPESFKSDLILSTDALARAGVTEVRGFRAPSFSIVKSTEWAYDVMAECGIRFDSSVFPTGLHPGYGIPDAPRTPYRARADIWEIPLSVMDLMGQQIPVGGGAYFRIFPYPLTRWAISRLNRKGVAAVVYLHPWEMDPGQPKIRTRKWRQFRQRVNLGRTFQRLERLLDEFRFVPLGNMIDV